MSSRQKGMLLAGVAVLLLAVEIGAVLLLAAGARMMTGNRAAHASLAAATVVAETVAGGALRAGRLALDAADRVASRVLPVADALPLVHAPTLEVVPAVAPSLLSPAAGATLLSPAGSATCLRVTGIRTVTARRAAREACTATPEAPVTPS